MALLVHPHPQLPSAEPVGEGPAPHRDQEHVALLDPALRPADHGDAHVLALDHRLLRRGAEAEPDPLLLQRTLEQERAPPVHRRHDAVHELQHVDLAAEPSPDRAQFQADGPGPHDHQPPRHFGERERAGRVDDAPPVEGDPRQLDGAAARGDQDALRRERLRPPLARDLDRPGREDPPGPGEARHAVLAEQPLDALRQLAHDLVLALHHDGEVQPDGGPDAVGGRVIAHEGEVLARVEQCLAGDAAHVQAGAAQRRVPFHAGDPQAELRGPDGGDVAAGS